MTPLQAVLFAMLALMVLAWFVCVGKLSRRLRNGHPEKYRQMGLEGLWPRSLAGWLLGHNNIKPVFALLRFLLRGEDIALHDADVSSLTVFMRRFFYVFLFLFLALVFSILSQGPDTHANRGQNASAARGQNAVEVSSRAELPRERVFAAYREKKWVEVIAAYDELLPESERDPKLTYWRGMAHWQLNHADEALQDFRRAIELDPGDFEAYRNVDRILSGHQRWDEILEMWNSYMERTPADAEAYFERGGTHFRKGNLVAARADAARACELGKVEACALAERLGSRL